MTNGRGPEDPGWGKAIRRFLPFVLMPVLIAKKPPEGEPRIVMVRTAFLAFFAALFALLAVLPALFPLVAAAPADPVVYALIAIGPFTLAAVPWARNRLLSSCAPSSELARAYTTSIFLSIAFVESAAMYGFVASFIAEAVWPYLVGMLVSAVGLAAIAPTSGRIRHLDESLSRRGCRHSLKVALFDPDNGGPFTP